MKEQRMDRAVTCTVEWSVDAPLERIFDEVVAEDVLPKVLRRYRLLPAVTGTRGNTGPWHVVGSQREISFSNGGTAREQVLEWARPTRFAYRVDRLPSPLGWLATHAIGAWDFRRQEGGSGFLWTYTFHARNRLAATALRAFVRVLWRGYMTQCAYLCAALAERQRT